MRLLPRRRRGLILLYHRVAHLSSDPQRLAVTSQHFAQHLEVLRRNTRPIELSNLATAIADGPTTLLPVAVSFDDGYADNAENGLRLLERYEIPATLFVTTGYVGGNREFWWDDLERLLLLPGRLPGILRLRIDGCEHTWALGSAAVYAEEDVQRHAGWHLAHTHDPTPRHRVYRDLCKLLGNLSAEQREAVLADLSGQSGAAPVGRATHRALTPEALAGLAASPRIEVGAHSVTHSCLTALDERTQRMEIEGSKARLEDIAGRPVTAFAYPFGGRRDYTPLSVRLVREAGFKLACANAPKAVGRRTDPWQLPRVIVRDWDGDDFARRISEWI